MSSSFDKLNEWFWNEHFWLPPNASWADVERDETIFIPKGSDLWIPLPMAVGLFLCRLIWERLVALPIGRWYKIKEGCPRPPAHSPVLEEAFRKHRKILPKTQLLELAKKADMSVRQVERWWRRRRVKDKPSMMQRFKETSWRFLFYLVAFWYGIYVLWDKPWFWDTKHCWYNFPRQHVSSEIWWYYMIELAFYWSLIISLFRDAKRKDFTEMIVHHIATISLMVLSWTDNMVRVGSLVLAVHDAVDYWLEGAKLAKYLGYNKFCDMLFIVFTVVWFITRICIYPLRILRCTLNEGHHLVGFFPAYYVFNVLLCMLQVLHIFWFYTICRMLYLYIVKGQVEKDGRSETEPESNSECEANGAASNGAAAPSNGSVGANAVGAINNNVELTNGVASSTAGGERSKDK